MFCRPCSIWWVTKPKHALELCLLKSIQEMSRRRRQHSYRGADKSLARPWKETSYSDQDLQHYIKIYGYKQQEYIPVVCSHKSWYSVLSLGRCSWFPSRVGLRTYQHPCTSYSKNHEYKTQLCGRQYWLVTYTVACCLYRTLPLLDSTTWFYRTTLASL